MGTDGVNTIEEPSILQRPGTLGWSVGRGEFAATGSEKLIVIGEAPSTPVLAVAGAIHVRRIGPVASGTPDPNALWLPPPGHVTAYTVPAAATAAVTTAMLKIQLLGLPLPRAGSSGGRLSPPPPDSRTGCASFARPSGPLLSATG